MQTRLPGIVRPAVICRVVVVMILLASVDMAMMMVVMVPIVNMVNMVNMVLVTMRMHVHEKSRERAARRRVGHRQSWRHSEHQRRRPNEDDGASACSLQLRQHAFPA